MGFLDDIKEGVEDFGKAAENNVTNQHTLGTIVDAVSQFATRGVVGFDAGSGKFGPGVAANAVGHGTPETIQGGIDIVNRWGSEAWGELTGANKRRAEEAAQRGIDAETAKRAQDLANEQARKQRQDIAASQAAGLSMQQASQQQKAYLGGGGSKASDSLTKDFLGLA